ncbi:MAG: hypothetical protein Q9166_001323 [cf. Caloplaca sp. 2 TL-2023]
MAHYHHHQDGFGGGGRHGGAGGRRGHGAGDFDGGRYPSDNNGGDIYEDEDGLVFDMSVPRRADEPRPGPWHQIMFEAMGGPYRCSNAGGCQAGGPCDDIMRRQLIEIATDEGYRGPPDPQQIRQAVRPFYEQIKQKIIREVAEMGENIGTEDTAAVAEGHMAEVIEIQAEEDTMAAEPMALIRDIGVEGTITGWTMDIEGYAAYDCELITDLVLGLLLSAPEE